MNYCVQFSDRSAWNGDVAENVCICNSVLIFFKSLSEVAAIEKEA